MMPGTAAKTSTARGLSGFSSAFSCFPSADQERGLPQRVQSQIRCMLRGLGAGNGVRTPGADRFDNCGPVVLPVQQAQQFPRPLLD